MYTYSIDLLPGAVLHVQSLLKLKQVVLHVFI